MLIGFLGPPCSAKTTTAALLFASLKDSGYPVEFVPEQARVYISKKRLLRKDLPVELTEEDQLFIMKLQSALEFTMSDSSPESIVVADSSPLNTLLYISPESRLKPEFVEVAVLAAARYDLLFRCTPVRPGVIKDPNRVHTFEQSLALDEELNHVLALLRFPEDKLITLSGNSKYRHSQAAVEVLQKLISA